MKEDLVKQAESMGEKDHLELKMMHEEWAPLGSWTIIPIIKRLAEKHGSRKHWIFFCEDDTIINLSGLLRVLSNHDARKELFLGHALQDQQAAIIHHFAFYEDPSQFSFPDFAAGWALSIPLLNRQVLIYNIAMFIRDEGRGTLLIDVPEFCTNQAKDLRECVTSLKSSGPECGDLSLDLIFFAVKTTKKYHKDRVPIVQKTVGKYAKHIAYYSETADPSIPTEDIGVPNTERGFANCVPVIVIFTTSFPVIRGITIFPLSLIKAFRGMAKSSQTGSCLVAPLRCRVLMAE
ncbi:Beta-1 [Acropora cervicornis]|uniref:N-acetylgalactosaminide beta-1,3-galactosyltransferase n=1 Tax=Acropora cervicornis TaxID=6130 RepID=A0AAD9VH79_ACRCE|nr:Beta-1 [Acropora cervicornis]